MIERIDEVLTQQLELLKTEIESFTFEERFEFELNSTFDDKLLELINHPGIYLFEISTNTAFLNKEEWLPDFINRWEDEKYKKGFVPNSRKSRVAKHVTLKEWLPIYLGKSKNIADRVKGHIYKKIHKPTGALKLIERKNLYGERFRVSTVKLNVRNYDLIMPQVEKSFRDKIHPILGRQ